MNNEKITITIPIKKAYYTSFINSLIPIHFYKDESISIDSLKNLLFPPSVSDEEFNILIKFIFLAFDEIIKNNRDKINLEKELRKTYDLNTEEVLDPIFNNVSNKSEEILTHLNSIFDNDEFYLKNLDWNVKTILSAKSENYLENRYTDMEFNLSKANKSKDYLTEVKNISICFTKRDVDKAFVELKRIKDNLKMINLCIDNLNNNGENNSNSIKS